MRTTIDIDAALLAEAQKLSGNATKKGTVDDALRLLVRLRRQEEMDQAFGQYRGEPRRMIQRGQVGWSASSHGSRLGRPRGLAPHKKHFVALHGTLPLDCFAFGSQ